MGKKTVNLGEELGFTAQELGQLQKTKELQTTVTNTYQHLTPPMRETCKLYENAQDFLKQFKGFMPESQAKELIHQTGIQIFPRPPGIPENYRVRLSDNGAGIIYVHPNHTHTSIRVMPGKPHSPHIHQQQPYIKQMRNGEYLDKYENVVNKEAPEAHIMSPYSLILPNGMRLLKWLKIYYEHFTILKIRKWAICSLAALMLYAPLFYRCFF